MEICPVRAELFHADGWTDSQTDRHDEANRFFRNFANTLKQGGSRNRIPFVLRCPRFCLLSCSFIQKQRSCSGLV
jgi:hypothetical protein